MIEPGDVVTAYLPGASETKRRPPVVVSTLAYHAARPDVLLALITSQVQDANTEFDAVIYDWREAGLKLPSAMRSFLFSKRAADVQRIGRLSNADWTEVQERLRKAVELS